LLRRKIEEEKVQHKPLRVKASRLPSKLRLMDQPLPVLVGLYPLVEATFIVRLQTRHPVAVRVLDWPQFKVVRQIALQND
jgi:hypothetical protein